MTKVYKQLKNNGAARKRIFYFFSFVIFANAVFYLFFINFGVSEIFAKKEIARKLNALREENQNLYGTHINEFKKINLDLAYSDGYIDDKNPSFVKRTSLIIARENSKNN